MAYKMSEILPNLYLGNIVNSMDSRHLKESNITHIVSVYEKPRKRYPDLSYLLIKAHDRENENLNVNFTEVNDFIHAARLQSSKVLVHCIKGVSRSATIVTAYIMSVTNLGWLNALHVVQSGRATVEPNKGFLRQLKEFEETGCEVERKRLSTYAGANELRVLDINNCEAVLQNWVASGSTETAVESSSTKENISMIYELNVEGEMLNSDICEDGARSKNVTEAEN